MYLDGATGRLADFAQKKYRGHRRMPESWWSGLEKEYRTIYGATAEFREDVEQLKQEAEETRGRMMNPDDDELVADGNSSDDEVGDGLLGAEEAKEDASDEDGGEGDAAEEDQGDEGDDHPEEGEATEERPRRSNANYGSNPFTAGLRSDSEDID